MIHPAEYNTLIIERFTDNGAYLMDAEKENEVLLPNRYLTDDAKEGQEIRVFVYFDSEDRPVATTEQPLITLNEVRSLKVVATTRIGAFVYWGLSKDILVPFKNQLNPMHEDEYHPVSIYIDQVTGRVVGTTKVGHLINNEEISVNHKQEVNIVISQRRDRGFRVIINQKHWGMLYDNQIFTPINIGDEITAYILKITEDNRIDVSLQQQGLDQVKVAVDILNQAFDKHNGILPYGDKTEPDVIQTKLGVSKKVFKKAVGYLFRQGVITIDDHQITKK